jgi:preprotein translocase subunit SecB
VTAEEPASRELPLFAIQLVDVFVREFEGARGPRESEGEPRRADIGAGTLRSLLAPDKKSFGVRLRVELPEPEGEEDDQALHLRFTVEGAFHSEDELTDEVADQFVESSALILLWPYARAYASQQASILGLRETPLPTLAVARLGELHPRDNAVPPPD